jgi:hypothetical protein
MRGSLWSVSRGVSLLRFEAKKWALDGGSVYSVPGGSIWPFRPENQSNLYKSNKISKQITQESYFTNIDKSEVEPITEMDLFPSQNSKVNIFPNPTNGIVFICGNNSTFISLIQINDLNGVTVYSTKLLSNKVQIDLSSYNSGIYIVRIFTENKVFMSKLVKL